LNVKKKYHNVAVGEGENKAGTWTDEIKMPKIKI
jgi:hypothetical protein